MTKPTSKPSSAKKKCALVQTTAQLTKKQEKTLAVVEQKEVDWRTIKEAIINMLAYDKFPIITAAFWILDGNSFKS